MKATSPFVVPVYPPATPVKGVVTAVLITGNTYPVKEEIKALGGRWNKQGQGWVVPVAVAAQAQALVDNAPEREARYLRRRDYSDRYQSNYAYFPSTGGEWYQNKNGRCEDSPACGCCS